MCNQDPLKPASRWQWQKSQRKLVALKHEWPSQPGSPSGCPRASPFMASLVYKWILVMDAPIHPLFTFQGWVSGMPHPLGESICLALRIHQVPLKSHPPCGTPGVWILNSLEAGVFALII